MRFSPRNRIGYTRLSTMADLEKRLVRKLGEYSVSLEHIRAELSAL